MARDSDKRAASFETENTGGLLSGILGRGGCFRPPRALAARIVGRGFGRRRHPGGLRQPILDRHRGANRSRPPIWRGSAANPVGRQGKPERGPAAGLRHRYPQRRSRPAVFPRHRAGTGPGIRDRRDHAANSAAGSPPATRRPPPAAPRQRPPPPCNRSAAAGPERDLRPSPPPRPPRPRSLPTTAPKRRKTPQSPPSRRRPGACSATVASVATVGDGKHDRGHAGQAASPLPAASDRPRRPRRSAHPMAAKRSTGTRRRRRR